MVPEVLSGEHGNWGCKLRQLANRVLTYHEQNHLQECCTGIYTRNDVERFRNQTVRRFYCLKATLPSSKTYEKFWDPKPTGFLILCTTIVQDISIVALILGLAYACDKSVTMAALNLNLSIIHHNSHNAWISDLGFDRFLMVLFCRSLLNY